MVSGLDHKVSRLFLGVQTGCFAGRACSDSFC